MDFSESERILGYRIAAYGLYLQMSDVICHSTGAPAAQ
jgi:hypothetical protein